MPKIARLWFIKADSLVTSRVSMWTTIHVETVATFTHASLSTAFGQPVCYGVTHTQLVLASSLRSVANGTPYCFHHSIHLSVSSHGHTAARHTDACDSPHTRCACLTAGSIETVHRPSFSIQRNTAHTTKMSLRASALLRLHALHMYYKMYLLVSWPKWWIALITMHT